MNRTHLISTLERLELYMSAGLPLDRAILSVAQSSHKKHRVLLGRVHEEIMSGSKISVSFARHLGLSLTLCGLIEHGESSGDLPKSLVLAYTMLERQGETFKKCISAMVYPVAIGLFASILTIGMVRGVMPQIAPMLKSLNISLPLLTRVVITISEYMVSYGAYVLGVLIALSAVFWVSYAKIRRFRYACQFVIMRIPIAGNMVFVYSLSLFLRSFGSLIESGMPVSSSYMSTSATVPLLPLKSDLLRRGEDIKRGVPCSQVIRLVSTKIPAHVPALLSAGEASGALGSSLTRSALIMDRDMDHGLKRLTALLEPAMMIGMGAAVGSIALSIMMPIYDVSKALQH